MKVNRQFIIKKNKISLVLFFCIFSNSVFSQNDIYIETYYKNRPDLTFSEERFNFTFLAKQGILIVHDVDLNVKKKYFVNFFHSQYTAKSEYYMVVYVEDPNKHYKLYKDVKGSMFSIFYDKKKGNVLAIKVQVATVYDLNDLYLTKKGKQIIKFDKN